MYHAPKSCCVFVLFAASAQFGSKQLVNISSCISLRGPLHCDSDPMLWFRAVARMVEEHAVPAAADNADITADLASDVADTGGNTGRRRGGKRGKRSNKHASPPPAADRAAAVPARGESPITTCSPHNEHIFVWHKTLHMLAHESSVD